MKKATLNELGLMRLVQMQDQLSGTLRNDQTGSADVPAAKWADPRSLTKRDFVTVNMDHVKYDRMAQLSAFLYRIQPKDKVPGLSNLGQGLFVQPNPLKIFESSPTVRVARGNAVPENMRQRRLTPEENQQVVSAQEAVTLEMGAGEYRDAIVNTIQATSGNKPIFLLVLGNQKDNTYQNAEAYAQCQTSEWHRQGNIANCDANIGGVPVKMYHANVEGFRHQNLDSRDLERLEDIYNQSIAAGNPITIHCTDGMDRAGGIAFAFHLMKNFDQIFVPGNSNKTKENIERAQAELQKIRGGNFCTAHENRLLGACQLAIIMKSVEMTRTLTRQLKGHDQEFANKLESMPYVQQIYALREYRGTNSESRAIANDLLGVLTARAEMETRYFKMFAKGIPHAQTTLLDLEKLAAQMPNSPAAKELTRIKQEIINGEDPGIFTDELAKVQTLLESRKQNLFTAVSKSPNTEAAAVSFTQKKSTAIPAAEPKTAVEPKAATEQTEEASAAEKISKIQEMRSQIPKQAKSMMRRSLSESEVSAELEKDDDESETYQSGKKP